MHSYFFLDSRAFQFLHDNESNNNKAHKPFSFLSIFPSVAPETNRNKQQQQQHEGDTK